ncbi:MAG: hypothetical protein KAT56_07945 [Sedimentisphaerales bacterium]|nr:hypothetical protein [Sedimentisphaerales bacterium]
MSTPPSTRRDRGIGSIAHFFLTKNNSPATDIPHRNPPSSSTTPLTPAPAPVSTPALVTTPENNERSSVSAEIPSPSVPEITCQCAMAEPASASPEVLLGETLLADHLSDCRKRIKAYVRYLTSQEERVALVNINDCEAQLLECDTEEKSDGSPYTVIAETEDITGLLIPALNELVENHDILLANLDKSFRERAGELIKNCTWVTVLCTCSDAEIVETYKTIKWLVQKIGWEDKIYLFVCDVPGESDIEMEKNALTVFDKIAETTRRFMQAEVELTGYEESPDSRRPLDIETEPSSEEIKHLPVSDDIMPENIQETNNARKVSNLKKARNDQEASDTQATNNDQASTAAHSYRDSANEYIRIEKNNKPAVHTPISVENLPRDDLQLCNALQLAISDWLKVVPGPMLVPLPLPEDLDPAGRIVIDMNGRLYILLAGLSADNNIPERALAGRNWLTDNISLVWDYCRQLQIDRTLQPGLILVAGGPIDSLKTVCSQISNFPCHILQLHFLYNGEKWSLLPMPV